MDIENIVRFVTANGVVGAEDRILARDTLFGDRLRTPVAGSIISRHNRDALQRARAPPGAKE